MTTATTKTVRIILNYEENALRACKCDGNTVTIPDDSVMDAMHRKAAASVLKDIGGKKVRGCTAYRFDDDAAHVIKEALIESFLERNAQDDQRRKQPRVPVELCSRVAGIVYEIKVRERRLRMEGTCTRKAAR